MHSFARCLVAVSVFSACAVAVQMANASTISRTCTGLGQVAAYDGPRSDVSDVTQFAYAPKAT